MRTRLRKPSREGILLAQYTDCVVIPPGPHKASELQDLLDWYAFTDWKTCFFGKRRELGNAASVRRWVLQQDIKNNE